MFTAAEWIGVSAGETGPRSDEKLTDEQKEKMKQRALAGEDPTHRVSFLLRGDFCLGFAPEEAVLSIAGLGFYRVTVNGIPPDENRGPAPIRNDGFIFTCLY